MEDVILFLKKGGVIIYPLLICSVIGVYIVIERLLTLRRKKIIIPEIVNVIESIKGPDDINIASSICEKNSGPFVNIINVALSNRSQPKDDLKESMKEQGRQEVHSLSRGLFVLETVGGIAPLLGLLGTVTGILKVFRVISEMGVGQASALSGGIAEALITTIIGLSIGIPAVVAYNILTEKAESLVLELEKHSAYLLKKLSSFNNRG